MTQPIPYSSLAPFSADLSHLRTLAICHYVWGGLTIAFSSVFIVHVIIGFAMASGRMATGGGPKPPINIGYIFAFVGIAAIAIGWTIGILTIISGRCLARQRNRTFSIVMAILNCFWVPLGTTLGVFTLVVLFRQSVAQLYQVAALPPATDFQTSDAPPAA